MNTCTDDFTIAVTAGCDCTTDWVANPGTCRLRITGYVNGVLLACFAATVSGSPAWDGTLPTLDQSTPPFTQYLAVNIGFSITGHVFNGSAISWTGAHWNMNIIGDTGGAPNAMWTGRLLSTCPIGVYTRIAGCQPGPASFTIEGYVP